MENLLTINAQITETSDEHFGQIFVEFAANKKVTPEIRYKTMLTICDTFLMGIIKEAKAMGTELDKRECFEKFTSDLLELCDSANLIKISGQ